MCSTDGEELIGRGAKRKTKPTRVAGSTSEESSDDYGELFESIDKNVSKMKPI